MGKVSYMAPASTAATRSSTFQCPVINTLVGQHDLGGKLQRFKTLLVHNVLFQKISVFGALHSSHDIVSSAQN